MAIARFLEAPERAALLARLPNPRDRLLLIIGFNSGLRLSEILSLNWCQIIKPDGEAKGAMEIHRRNLKGGHGRHRQRLRSREIPLNAAIRAAVNEYRFTIAGSGVPPLAAPVFRSRKRSPGRITRWHAHEIIKGAAERAGLEGKVASHSMRRSFAVNCYKATGHDLAALQALLGHASPTTSAIYVCPRREELAAVYDKLADFDAPLEGCSSVAVPHEPTPKVSAGGGH